jgi:DNA-directed RNA polymerase specialized sigma24 family protein
LVTSSSDSVGSEMRKTGLIISATQPDHVVVVDDRFSRYRPLLYFIATRVLGSTERADEAVRNCWLSASRNPGWIESGGRFRSWLVRVLIDEALAIRRQCWEANKAKAHPEQVTSSSSSIKMTEALLGETK